jgi:hypothetical protein
LIGGYREKKEMTPQTKEKEKFIGYRIQMNMRK